MDEYNVNAKNDSSPFIIRQWSEKNNYHMLTMVLFLQNINMFGVTPVWMILMVYLFET